MTIPLFSPASEAPVAPLSEAGASGRASAIGAPRARGGAWQLLAWTSACALLGGSLLLHAWVRTTITSTGYRLEQAARATKELQARNERLRIRVARLSHPARIEELARGRLGMEKPGPERVVALVGGRERATAAPADGFLAAK